MMSSSESCPLCGRTERVSKVSAIYIAGIQAKKTASADPLVAPGKISGIPLNALPALSRRLAPPAGRKSAGLRLIHPDQILLVFSLITPIFLFGIYSSQRVMFYPVLLGLAISYGLYLWQRKAVIARFERQVQAERSRNERIHNSIRRWMNLYYCADDDVVFEPGGLPPVPVDQMPGYLLRES